MNTPARLLSPLVAILLLGLAGCGGGGDDPPPAPPVPPPPPGTLVGAGGGTVTGPAGTSVVIPAGALTAETRINIEQTTVGSPALPAGFVVAGQMFAITPHGTTFASPVTVTLPFDPALLPAGRSPALFKTNAQNEWERVPNAVFGASSVTAQVSSFSHFDVGGPPRVAGKPINEWEVFELKGDALVPQSFFKDVLDSGELAEHYDFGVSFRDAPVINIAGSVLVPSDQKATAQFAASADGIAWAFGTEAPLGVTGFAESSIGTRATFKQTQTFIKRELDATLSFLVVDAKLQTTDLNGVLGRTCPKAHRVSLYCDMISAQIAFRAEAFTVPSGNFTRFKYFFKVGGTAALTGLAGSWDARATTAASSQQKMWSTEQFKFDIESVGNAEEALITMKLARPIFQEYVVDLSSIAVGQAFTLRFDSSVTAYNRAASSINGTGTEFETSAAAYLGTTETPHPVNIDFDGLEPIDTPDPGEEPVDEPVSPAPCTAPTPAAGSIQFDAANYLQSESNVISPIAVTRTGGNTGDVTATFTTSNGSAIAGTDYTAVTETVFFSDGDSEPRVVNVLAIANDAFDEPDKTVNLTLTQPGACATLGAQSTAVLSIQDDDSPPPPPAFTVGGTVAGLEGTGLVLRDQHFLPISPGNGPFTLPAPTVTGDEFEVIVVTQPTNPVQVCTVVNGSGVIANSNVTNVQVNCVTAPPASGLDPGFGGTGKISSAFGGDETDMLLQPDGKVIMIGGSASDFILARYNADGTPDSGFGTAGLVTTDIAGSGDAALAAVLQGEKIIVVGYARVGSTDDFAVVRYNANGTPDTTFGTQGKVTTDFFGQRNRAYAVAIAPDGQILVAGETVPTSGTSLDFALARYSANGTFDATFGGAAAGKVSTDVGGAVDQGRNIVIESGGTILVSGTITLSGSPVLEHLGMARYTANGLPDNSLDTDGKLTISGRAVGEGLALTADGKILGAGHTTVGGTRVFALMRLLASGAPDNGFGTAGLATTQFSTLGDFGRDITLQPDGRILVSGESSNGSNPDFAVARYLATGAPDNSFDGDGKLTIDFFSKGDSAENVAVQLDGKIVLGGFAVNGTAVRYGIARFVP